MINKKINDRAFNAFLNGTKKIEIRANKNDFSKNSFNIADKNDIVIFTNIDTNEKLKCIIERKTLYKTIRILLKTEGTKYTLSSTNNLKKGIKSIESIKDYRFFIKKNGVFAIKFKSIRKI